MKLVIRRTSKIWTLSVMAALLLCGAIFAFTQMSRTSAVEGDGRLITIYDRGTEQLLLSEGATIKDALDEAGIVIDERDVVEPALTEKLVASEYKVNIYRARPVTVIDGATRQKIMTAYQTADQILEHAGIESFSEDVKTLSRSDDLIGDGAGLQLMIDRATLFNLSLHGSQTSTRTQGETVGEMLKEKNITLGENDRVSPSEDTPLTKDMAVRVWREGKQTITVEETVAFTTEQIRDADRPTNYKAVQTEGKNGARKVTYEIEIRDGQEVSRSEIAALTISEPVKQVEVIGTKPTFMPYTGGGTKTEWLAASNIPQESWGYADYMVGRESGWNPNAINSSSGACGLAQALPCSKVPGDPLNPVNSLNWMNGYVNGRYGGWAQAYAFWQANHWY